MRDFVESGFSTTMGVAIGFLGIAIAVDRTWLTLAAGGVVAALVLGRLAIGVRRAGLERLYREKLRRSRTRVPVEPIAGVSPADVGIPAPALRVLPGGPQPHYLSRDGDSKLHEAVEKALRGVGPWIVLATGGPKVGKSRSLFEALLSASPDIQLDFVAPLDVDALRALTDTPRLDRRSVLWLDDLEPFLSQGLTFETLLQWHRAVPDGIVAATYGSKGGDLQPPACKPLALLSAEIRERAEEVPIQPMTAAEAGSLRSLLAPAELSLVERHGLAAYLSAVPALLDKLSDQGEATEAACPEGVALVNAAIDWVRCGRTDPIGRDVLREVWPSYLRADMRVTSSGFVKGMEWALGAVAPGVALLKRRGLGYQVDGYVASHVDETGRDASPPEGMWGRAMGVANAAEALPVGASAYRYGNYRNALAAFKAASHTGDPWLEAAATFNTGVTLDQLGEPEEAISVYTRVIQGLEADSEMRRLVAKAMVNKGLALAASDRSIEALATFDEVLGRHGQTSNLEVARALLGKGDMFRRLEQFDYAIASYDRVLNLLGDATEPELREQAGVALVAKGELLTELGRLDEALETYAEAISRHGEGSTAGTARLVGRAQFNYGLTLATQGRSEEAIAIFESVTTRYEDAADPALRELAEQAVASRNLAIGGLKRRESSPPGDAEVIERTNVAVAEGLQADFERNLREPVRIAGLELEGLDFFADSNWALHPSVNVLLGRNGYGKSLLLRIVAGMLQRHAEATGSLFAEGRSDGRIELSLVRGKGREKIARDRSVFLRGSLGKVPLLAIPDARFMDRSAHTLADPEALDLATDGARNYLEQIPYQRAVEGMLSGLALDYWQHKSFDLPTFDLINDVLARLADRALEFRRIERVGRTGSRIWVRTEGLDRDLEIQQASQGTLSVIAIFGLVYSFLQELANVRGAPEDEVRSQAAIVVIDEIDAHLHPVWQQRIRNTLVEIFPQVQFLLTAHSPLIVAGCGPNEVSVLRRSPNGHEIWQLDKDFVGAAAGDLYTEIFDVEDLDETFLRYARMEASGEGFELERQIDDLLAKESDRGWSEDERLLSEQLLFQRARLARVEEIGEERRSAEERALEKDAEITRLKRRRDDLGTEEKPAP